MHSLILEERDLKDEESKACREEYDDLRCAAEAIGATLTKLPVTGRYRIEYPVDGFTQSAILDTEEDVFAFIECFGEEQ